MLIVRIEKKNISVQVEKLNFKKKNINKYK